MKIFYKLTLIFIFIALLPSLSIGYLSFKKGESIISNDIKEHLVGEADSLLELIDRVIYNKQQDIISLSESSILKNEKSDLGEIKKELFKLKNKEPDYISLSFFNMDRIRLVDTKDLDIGVKHNMVPYWEDALLGKISAGRDIRIAEELNVPIIYFAAPIYNNSGKPIGVVTARYNPKKISELINSFKEQEEDKEELEIILINSENNIIASTDPYHEGKILEEKIFNLSSVQQAKEGKNGIIEEYYPPKKRNALISFVSEKGFFDFTGNGWTLITISNKEKALAPITNFRNQIFIFSVFILFISVITGLFYGKTISKSIEKLTDVAQKIAAGDIKQRAVIESKDEMGYLANVFNQMIEKIEKDQKDLKEAEEKLEIRVKERILELGTLKDNLEKIVTEKTEGLQKNVDELERFKSLAVGRELKMVELKKEVMELKEQLKEKNNI
ncbi:hypothetical protein COY96_01015 [Candidatus Wolfebacteria bacterium CG_4_10_14_0_8_um_filter_37_11]|uniref:histidine kinase n=1 Tax=Candidatus Wolfebacteria bacterium CG_4_10_14_0_8_um_filter_37_11 TaxID=1975062 RepID=A0A2M7Q8Y1_9BACT|nr:MAG: hypothetical protein COY96_01015 [Candidatus Wolfebacteria bacterium CG_4_10_14_0_8_um_filter_37_11]